MKAACLCDMKKNLVLRWRRGAVSVNTEGHMQARYAYPFPSGADAIAQLKWASRVQGEGAQGEGAHIRSCSSLS